ncbi:MAG: fumarate hydratase [Deltaproteobacteria bacterium]|nr:fumarate hydratase [Deltaproteobacteria bacterium]
MPEFKYQKMFELGKDETSYRKLTDKHVSMQKLGDKEFLQVEAAGLTLLAQEAMHDVSFYLRPAHQEQVAAILRDDEASPNDKFVARTMLKNSVISAEGQLPTCQDTGTAMVVGKRGQDVLTSGEDEEALSRGIYQTYAKDNLRYSQVAPLSMYEEKNTGTNLPAQIDIYATKGASYSFLFVAKGGGSANKAYLFQQTKALLNPETLVPFLTEKMKSIGTSACPPYHLAIVIGGTSAETCLKTVKLASTGYLDSLPTTGNEHGRAFRDRDLEQVLLKAAQKIGLGAQFGGKHFAHDVRVIRMPRHGASCPVGMAVSCSADRNIKAKIDREGIWLEEMERDPARLLVGDAAPGESDEVVKINLDRPMDEVIAELAKYPVKTRLSLTGTMVVARDIAHAKLKARVDAGEGLPEYFKKHPVYYAGPAKTPKGMASGSFGPTTAQRMDPYVDLFQQQGGSMVMIAKGNRTKQVTDACQEHGGFYLGSIGGPAAILAKESITKVEVLDYEELGMEAVWKIQVVDFPAFILVDDKGNDFFEQLSI